MYRKSAYFLFVAVLGLLVIGIVMLFSTSAFAKDSHGDPYFFLKHQSLWLGVGLAVCIAAALIDYHFWQHTWWIWLGVATITLVFCFIPHIGMRINGSRRWIGFGPIGFQPSEIAQLVRYFFSPGGSRVMRRQPVIRCSALLFRWRSSLLCSR